MVTVPADEIALPGVRSPDGAAGGFPKINSIFVVSGVDAEAAYPVPLSGLVPMIPASFPFSSFVSTITRSCASAGCRWGLRFARTEEESKLNNRCRNVRAIGIYIQNPLLG